MAMCVAPRPEAYRRADLEEVSTGVDGRASPTRVAESSFGHVESGSTTIESGFTMRGRGRHASTPANDAVCITR
jgi:hypothetical protein